jgi:hypothetical protein
MTHFFFISFFFFSVAGGKAAKQKKKKGLRNRTLQEQSPDESNTPE